MHNKASYGDAKLYINMMSSANEHAKAYLRDHVKGQIDVIKNRVRQPCAPPEGAGEAPQKVRTHSFCTFMYIL